MATFSDFDEFLRSGEFKKQEDGNVYHLRIKQAHQELQPFLREAFELFKDYNESILQPRKPHFVVLKKQEAVSEREQKAAFLYRINTLPRSLFASHFNPHTTEGANYIRPNIVTKDDWYLKVALQFDVALLNLPKENILTPSLHLRVWGRIASSSPVSSEIDITHTESFGKIYTTLSYWILNPDDHLWQRQLKELFMIATPAVLSHTREVFGVE